jgi:hypothetical protein
VITITEKEKQYLLSVDAKQFIDKLYSKSLFYELFNTDITAEYNFSIVSVLSIYNFVLNIIYSNIFEALNLRHSKLVGGQLLKLYPNIGVSIIVEPDDDKWQFSNDKKTYKYTISNINPAIPPHYRFTIYDELYLKETIFTVHLFKINFDDIGEFISKMLILYNDFVDNIPV